MSDIPHSDNTILDTFADDRWHYLDDKCIPTPHT